MGGWCYWVLIDAKYSWCYGGDPRVEILPKMEPLKGHPAPSSTVVGLRAWRNCRGRHTDSRLGFPCGNLDHWHLKHALNWKEGSRGHKKANRFSFWAPAGTADLGCFKKPWYIFFLNSKGTISKRGKNKQNCTIRNQEYSQWDLYQWPRKLCLFLYLNI